MQDFHFEKAVNYDDALWRAARESAVDESYWDIFGKQHYASREALAAILRSLGWNVESFEAIENERRLRFARRGEIALPQTSVVGEHAKWLSLTTPDGEGSLCYEITFEDGQALSGALELQQLPKLSRLLMDDRAWFTYRLDLPAEVPLGYHSLKLTINGRSCGGNFFVIVCPHRTYLPERLAKGGKTAGFNIALYGLRSQRNWGCGDFTDLKILIDWARKDAGFSFIGLNPLHALHNRTPYNVSPYLPLSMYYKNLIYLDIEGIEEFRTSKCAQSLARSPQVQKAIRDLREAEYVEYAAVHKLKLRFLKVLYREFLQQGSAERRRQFADYCQEEGELLSRFALYCALDETLHKRNPNLWTWRDWPQAFQDPGSPEAQAFAGEHSRMVGAYKYIQFVIEQQLAAAQEHAMSSGMSVGLYHDLAVATDNFGSDLWAYRDFYVNGCRVGAPPDDFSPSGQDWGFPPPNKETHRADGYRLYRESIRKIVRHGGALRIDHVMRLYRLFWVPNEMSPASGAYVRDYANDLMHVLALESVRNRNIIVGEDLGTVTDEMRELFTRFGILSYRLFPFEKNYQTGEYKNSFEYPTQALVSSSTHDLPTLAGFWEGRDIEARRNAGLADEAGARQQHDDRRREKQRMLDTLHSEGMLPSDYTRTATGINGLDGELHNAAVGFLAQVPSLLLLLNQEDFTKERNQQNLPGSTAEYPNWQRKMNVMVEELTGPEWQPYSAMFRHHLERTGRAD